MIVNVGKYFQMNKNLRNKKDRNLDMIIQQLDRMKSKKNVRSFPHKGMKLWLFFHLLISQVYEYPFPDFLILILVRINDYITLKVAQSSKLNS